MSVNVVNNSSGFKGVSWNVQKKKWQAVIRHNKRQMHLGCYTVPELAACAYDHRAIQINGEFALTNYRLGLVDHGDCEANCAARQQRTYRPTLDVLAIEFPRWNCWQGVNKRYYARLLNSSPPIVLNAEDTGDLRDQIRERDRTARIGASKSYA